jgi:hypothetical protein
MREAIRKALYVLLNNAAYDDLNEEQISSVVALETALWKQKVDELRSKMSPDEIIEVIHDWWLNYEIANETEDNLLAYV